jgi:hypothetical protein
MGDTKDVPMTDAERKELNRKMFDWFNGVTRCSDDDDSGEWNAWEVQQQTGNKRRVRQ